MAVICLCAVCCVYITEDQPMADHKIYKYGELSYISLAHRDCVIRDNTDRGDKFWEYDEPQIATAEEVG